MNKSLIIAEKPSVAKEIAEALGGFSQTADGFFERGDAIVSSGIGHLIEIFSSTAESTKAFEALPIIPDVFELRPITKTESQFRLLKKLMKRADVSVIVNACDAGREGELIFRLIYQAAGCQKTVKRMWLQSMTHGAIVEAYKDMKPGREFDGLDDAARCRGESDWLIGINGSRGISHLRMRQTQKYEMLSAGRVQTPTAAMIVDREHTIKNFVPVDYWEIHATIGVQAGTYVGKWTKVGQDDHESSEDGEADGADKGKRIFNREQAEAIVAKCRGVNPSSVTDTSKVTSSLAPKLFDLTTLQREANKKFKFSAKKTLDLAQSLYEKHKVLSYPRTDSNCLPEDYVATTGEIMGAFAGTLFQVHAQRVLGNGWIKQDKRIFDNSKISDHFAIIPTGVISNSLSEDESKIYDMVTKRFIAVFHPAAEYNVTKRVSVIAGETFETSGKVLLRQGWLEVYGIGLDAKESLCALVPGEQGTTQSVEAKAAKTTPPSRYTEATLLSAMESAGKLLVDDDELRDAMKERGLGTPATRAAIIEGLLSDKGGNGVKKEPMVVRDGKEQWLVPTPKCMNLIAFLNSSGISALTSPRMTGEWEHKLRLMEKGEYRRDVFMREIADMTRSIIDVIRKQAGQVQAAPEKVLQAPCPKCGGEIVSRARVFECKTQNCVKISREKAKREFTDSEIEQLLRDGEITTPLAGFVKTDNSGKFSAGLKLDLVGEHLITYVFPDRAQAASGAKGLGVACPRCGGAVKVMEGQYPSYSCEKGDFKLWKVVAGRPLSDSEAKTLIQTGSLSAVHGFKSSKSKNKFSAGLKLNGDKVDMVFEPR